jgi:hypothetical protein
MRLLLRMRSGGGAWFVGNEGMLLGRSRVVVRQGEVECIYQWAKLGEEVGWQGRVCIYTKSQIYKRVCVSSSCC